MLRPTTLRLAVILTLFVLGGPVSHAAILNYDANSQAWNITGAEAEWSINEGMGTLDGEPGALAGGEVFLFGIAGGGLVGELGTQTNITNSFATADNFLLELTGDMTYGGEWTSATTDTPPGVAGRFYIANNNAITFGGENFPAIGASLNGIVQRNATNSAFRFTAAVPEPSGASLLLLATSALAFRRRLRTC